MSHSQVLQEGLVLGVDVVAQVEAARKDLTRVGRRYETRKVLIKCALLFRIGIGRAEFTTIRISVNEALDSINYDLDIPDPFLLEIAIQHECVP